MGRILDRGVLIGLGSVVVLLVVIPVLTYRNTNQLNEDARWVAHTQEVLGHTADVLLTLVDAETGQRGFIITGKDDFLQPYNAALGRLDERLAKLKDKTQDNPRQQDNIRKLKAMTTKCLALLEEGIALRRKSDQEAAAFIAAKKGKEQMDAIRELVGEMKREETDLLKEREGRSSLAHQTAVTTGILSALLGLGLFGVLIWLLRRSFMARLKAAVVLQEQREWFHTTLASIGDTVIATDTEGHVVFLNSVAENLTGWKEEAKGQPLEVVFRIVNEDTRKPVENPALRALKQGTIVGLANHTILIAKDGTERPIDDSAAPIRNAAGSIAGSVLVFRDISNRRRLEKESRRQQDLLTMAEAAARIGHFEWDIPDDDSRWSPEMDALYGLPPGGYEGGNAGWRKLVDPSNLSKAEEDVRESFTTGRLQTEFRAVWPNGTVRWLEARAVVSRDGDGKPVRMVGINMDITERKQAEEALRDGDRRKDEFLATLAHELRNPLAPIRNGLQVLKLARGDCEAVEQTRAMMERQVGQMVRLIDDLLDLSRIRQGKVELRKERVELGAAVDNALETSRPLIEGSGHHLTITVPPDPINVDGDVTRLAQVFTNLLNNAAKCTEKGGHVTLTVERQGSEAVVSVRDTGVGIPPHMLPKIFDMFTQVDGSLEKSQGGLGIGLSLVKGLVEMHGGSVEARSDGHGTGSEFVVRLPVVLASISKQRDDSGGEVVSSAARRRILIVDDNRESAISLAKLLEIMGNETQTAHDGLEALDLAAAFRPDVMLLDIGMPKMNGYDTARHIREQAWGSYIVLVALTGWGQDEDRRKSQEAGFNLHMVKPVEPQALEELLAGLQATTA